MGKRYAEETTAEHGRERWGGGTRSRSPPREGQAFRSSGYYQGTDEGDRRVFVCWNKFVSEDFLYAHFERFGRVEHIYKAHGGQYGFVNFSKEEVGRSLLGEVHNVEGVQLKINRAKPDMLTARIREDRGGRYAVRTRSEVCALFREGRCLRGNYCEFQHIGESPRTSQESWQDNSYEKQRSRGRRRSTSEEQLWAHESTYGIKANNIRKEGSSHSALHLTGSKERDGRLRPPPSTKKKKRRVSLQVSPECKSPVHEKHSKEEVVEESSIKSTSSLNREKVQEDQSRVIVCIEKRQTSSKREKTKEKHRSQVSKECNKSKRKKEGKMSKEFLASLGLSDPIGAMAGVVSMSTGPLKTQDDEPIKTDEPVDTAEQIPRSSTIKSLVHDRPLVPQLVQLARDLPHLDVDQHQDLALHFPSLLAVPQLEQVVRVFLRFHQRSPEDLSKTERQFADLLVTELHCSNIKEVKDLEEVVADVYKRRPDSTMDGWIREITLVNPGLESMALVDQMELCFDLDVAMQVIKGSE